MRWQQGFKRTHRGGGLRIFRLQGNGRERQDCLSHRAERTEDLLLLAHSRCLGPAAHPLPPELSLGALFSLTPRSLSRAPTVQLPYSNFLSLSSLTLLSKITICQSWRLLHAEKNNSKVSTYYALRNIDVLPMVSWGHKGLNLKEWISNPGHFTSMERFLGDFSVS